jgi:hypothetical protein
MSVKANGTSTDNDAAGVTIENLFDLVAPVYIYHKADIQYRAEAERALRRLKDFTAVDFEPHISHPTAARLAEAALALTADEADPNAFWEAYDLLFPALVTREYPALRPDHDPRGACCFRDSEGGVRLDGDACGHYPYYLSYEALADRLRDLKNELPDFDAEGSVKTGVVYELGGRTNYTIPRSALPGAREMAEHAVASFGYLLNTPERRRRRHTWAEFAALIRAASDDARAAAVADAVGEL